jgi:hypothetical protein
VKNKKLKKFLRWILCTACLVWLVVAIFLLLNKENNKFNPKVLFSEKGALVTIIHRPSEVNLEDLFPQISSGMHNEISAILSFTDKKKARIYFSSFRDFCLIEGVGVWTYPDVVLLSKYLGSRPNSEGNSIWKLNSKFWCTTNSNRLILYKSSIKNSEISDSKCWDLWDKNASYSLLSPSIDKVENVYSNRSERYISQSKSNAALPLIDDYEIYSSSLPEGITKYQFYQKNAFLIKVNPQEKNCFNWFENGVVVFETKAETCLLFDPALGYSPFDMFENEGVDGRTDLVKFSLNNYNFPSLGFEKQENYGIKVGSNYIICGNLKIAESIQSDYKLGQTFALKESELKEGFFQLPKRVSIRSISKQGFETISYLLGLVHSTTLRTISPDEEIKGDLVEEKGEVLATLRGDIQNFYAMHNPKGLPFYLIQTTNQATQFIDANTNKQLNDLTLVQQSVPTRIVLENSNFWNLHSDLSFNLIDVNGNSRTGYPINLPKTASSNIVIIKENGANFYLFGTPNGTIEKYNASWKFIKTFSISSLPIKSIQYSKNGDVLININNQEWFIGSLKNGVKGKTFSHAIKTVLEVTDPEVSGKFFTSDNGMYFVSPTQEPILLKTGEGFRMHQIKNDGNSSNLLYSLGNSLYLISSTGKEIFKFKTNLNAIEAAYYCDNNGKISVAVLDGIQNNISLHEQNGTLLKEQNWEGSKFVHLQKVQNQLTLLTFVGRYLIKYKIKSL